MNRLAIGHISSYRDANRYTISLSNSKQLVLFKLVKIDDRKCESNSDGLYEYFCMNQECPHAGGPMEDSSIEYDIEDDAWIASCPWHSYDFNVETGDSSFGIKTCTYPVTIEADHIWLDVLGDVALSAVTPVSEKFRAPGEESISKITSLGSRRGLAGVSDTSLLNSNASICEWCVEILNTPDPEQKIYLTHQLYQVMTQTNCENVVVGQRAPPDVPPRTSLKSGLPDQMPNAGRAGNLKSRITILHSLANIEQWAIDLALDICARFATFVTKNGTPLPKQFFLDWIKVANDEAKHFSLLRARLKELGSKFGELPVHHGLWDSATLTAHDLRARISIIALVHEARGLDVNPQTIAKFRTAGDMDSVTTLETIHKDEITHVTTGHRWLTWICEDEGEDPVQVFRSNVSKYFKGAVKGPFNAEDRQKAGLEREYYENLAGRPKTVLISGG